VTDPVSVMLLSVELGTKELTPPFADVTASSAKCLNNNSSEIILEPLRRLLISEPPLDASSQVESAVKKLKPVQTFLDTLFTKFSNIKDWIDELQSLAGAI